MLDLNKIGTCYRLSLAMLGLGGTRCVELSAEALRLGLRLGLRSPGLSQLCLDTWGRTAGCHTDDGYAGALPLSRLYP